MTGPHPVSVDGRLFEGLPDRELPLDELRDRLLQRRCPQTVRDAAWVHLVRRSRTEGSTWTVGCVGVGLPALLAMAARLTARFAGDPSDVHAAILAGFLAELETVDLGRPRIMVRLRWAAYRAGLAAVREALDAPVPCGNGFRSSQPPPPWGHPDLVLARAVADGVITVGEADLIGATRLERVPMALAARQLGRGYEAVKKARLRAERRLVGYLVAQTHPDGDFGHTPQVSHGRRVPGSAAPWPPDRRSPRSGRPRRALAASERLSRPRRSRGVQACGRSRAHLPLTAPVGRQLTPPPDPTREVPPCV